MTVGLCQKARLHPGHAEVRVTVERDGRRVSAMVDRSIAPLIEAMWEAGITTRESCEGGHGKRAKIIFDGSGAELERLIAAAWKFATPGVRHRMDGSANRGAWAYSIFPYGAPLLRGGVAFMTRLDLARTDVALLCALLARRRLCGALEQEVRPPGHAEIRGTVKRDGGGVSATVDQGMARLLEAMWEAGITTRETMEGGEGERALIIFDGSGAELERLIASAWRFATSGLRRRMRRSANRGAWDYLIYPSGAPLLHGGVAFATGLSLPRTDVDVLYASLERLRLCGASEQDARPLAREASE